MNTKTEQLSFLEEEHKFTEVDRVIGKMMARLAQFEGYTPPANPLEMIHEVRFAKKPSTRLLKWYHYASALYQIVSNEF